MGGHEATVHTGIKAIGVQFPWRGADAPVALSSARNPANPVIMPTLSAGTACSLRSPIWSWRTLLVSPSLVTWLVPVLLVLSFITDYCLPGQDLCLVRGVSLKHNPKLDLGVCMRPICRACLLLGADFFRRASMAFGSVPCSNACILTFRTTYTRKLLL